MLWSDFPDDTCCGNNRFPVLPQGIQPSLRFTGTSRAANESLGRLEETPEAPGKDDVRRIVRCVCFFEFLTLCVVRVDVCGGCIGVFGTEDMTVGLKRVRLLFFFVCGFRG